MREAIDQVIESGEMEKLIAVLEGARMPEVRYAVRQIARAKDGKEPLADKIERFASRSEPTARHIACGLLSESYADAPEKSIEILYRFIDDEDRAVRESAAVMTGKILRLDFEAMSEVLREWREDSSENVRRAVVIAAMKAAQTRRLEWAEPLLKLIEPLLCDHHAVVRRNLGPFALGTTLLKAYPSMTFEYLVKWSTETDEQTLWNVAMAFSASGAPPLVKRALIVLRKLALDERRYVWRAAAAAMWKLGRKKPEVVRPELARWLEDERRVHVAREALKYL